MDPITPHLADLLRAYGPWLIFALAILETSFLTGLAVPSGIATALGTVLALEGSLGLGGVVVAAVAGGAVGDSLGFWIGRGAGARVFSGDGPWSRAVEQRRHALSVALDRHPFFGVTLPRLVSFVRTLMPMAAGMSGMRYRHFLAYELPGLVACVGLYVAVGFGARESWSIATRVMGVGGALLLVVVTLVLWWNFRNRNGASTPDAVEESS